MTRTPAPSTADDPAALLDLLQCLARSLRDDARQAAVAHGLLLVHWQVLWFLQAANRYSNTVQILAAYLGQTKGSVSQTVQLLEARGLLKRRQDIQDRRVMRLLLTPKGRGVLAAIDGASPWPAAAAMLPREQAGALRGAVTALLRDWQRTGGGATFGVCRTCSLFQVEPGGRFRCGLTNERLYQADSGRICRAHRLPA